MHAIRTTIVHYFLRFYYLYMRINVKLIESFFSYRLLLLLSIIIDRVVFTWTVVERERARFVGGDSERTTAEPVYGSPAGSYPRVSYHHQHRHHHRREQRRIVTSRVKRTTRGWPGRSRVTTTNGRTETRRRTHVCTTVVLLDHVTHRKNLQVSQRQIGTN